MNTFIPSSYRLKIASAVPQHGCLRHLITHESLYAIKEIDINNYLSAHLAGVVEYTDCRWVRRPPQRVSWVYSIKQSDGEAPLMLEF